MTRALLKQALDALENEKHPCQLTEMAENIRAHLAHPQGAPVAATGEDLAIYQSIADNYHKSLHPAHTEAEVRSLLSAAFCQFGNTGRGTEFEAEIRRILGVPAP